MILAIDPGPTQSGFVVFNPQSRSIAKCGVRENHSILLLIEDWAPEPGTTCAIEMIASFGLAVGAEVFETCVWIGRFVQHWHIHGRATIPSMVYRQDVKMHLCHQTRGVTDAVIRRRLLDVIGPQGTKKTPGPTYGMTSHMWPALAVAVYAAEQTK